MRRIETREAKYRLSCVSCDASVRACEKYLQVVTEAGGAVKGEKYCLHCEEEARENNDICGDSEPDYGEGERARETFGAYLAAGCPSVYFDDQH